MSICFNEKMNVLGFWNEEKRFENIDFLDRYFPYTPNLSFQRGYIRMLHVASF